MKARLAMQGLKNFDEMNDLCRVLTDRGGMADSCLEEIVDNCIESYKTKIHDSTPPLLSLTSVIYIIIGMSWTSREAKYREQKFTLAESKLIKDRLTKYNDKISDFTHFTKICEKLGGKSVTVDDLYKFINESSLQYEMSTGKPAPTYFLKECSSSIFLPVLHEDELKEKECKKHELELMCGTEFADKLESMYGLDLAVKLAPVYK